MQGLNKAILIGTVDEPPRLHRSGGRPRLALRVRTVEAFTDPDGGERERRAWHDVIVWGRYGEALFPCITRGTNLAIEGRIVSSSWEGPDGRRRWRTEIHANEVALLDRASGQRDSRPAAKSERDAA